MESNQEAGELRNLDDLKSLEEGEVIGLFAEGDHLSCDVHQALCQKNNSRKVVLITPGKGFKSIDRYTILKSDMVESPRDMSVSNGVLYLGLTKFYEVSQLDKKTKTYTESLERLNKAGIKI